MTVTQAQVDAALQQIELPDGGTLVSRDMIRALSIDTVSYTHLTLPTKRIV